VCQCWLAAVSVSVLDGCCGQCVYVSVLVGCVVGVCVSVGWLLSVCLCVKVGRLLLMCLCVGVGRCCRCNNNNNNKDICTAP